MKIDKKFKSHYMGFVMYPKSITYFIEICDWAGKIGLIAVIILSLVGLLPRYLLLFLLLIYLPDLMDIRSAINHKRTIKRIRKRKPVAILK